MHLHGKGCKFIDNFASRRLISHRQSNWSIAERTFGVVLPVKTNFCPRRTQMLAQEERPILILALSLEASTSPKTDYMITSFATSYFVSKLLTLGLGSLTLFNSLNGKQMQFCTLTSSPTPHSFPRIVMLCTLTPFLTMLVV
jgi:hypothetical protein